MAKIKSERLNPKPAFYAVLYGELKDLAKQKGYALAIHGSLASDLDLAALAFRDSAVGEEELVETLWSVISGFSAHYAPEESQVQEKPQRSVKSAGRIVYVFPIWKDWYVDISIYPPVKK